VDVTYAVQNHSDSPSPRIYAECFLKDVKGCVDREISAFNHRAIMPRQKMEGHASLLVTSGADPKRIVDDINRAKIGIRIYVLSFDAIGKKSSFIETFYKINGKFTV